ncbi:MAG: hypothetical protein M1826_006293 [Phylliscum demangeonii]|nr:MAG: hypothetical protein M1826_006293 [Phylliscum demangeonii]
MPVKWTPEYDQMLLLKILETHPTLSVDTSAVSAAWPTDKERPSARAITERLVRIRKNAGMHFAVRSAQQKGAGSTGAARSAPSTPRKPKAQPAAAADAAVNGSGGGAGGKRERTSPVKTEWRGGLEEEGEEEEEEEEEDPALRGLKVIAPEIASLRDGHYEPDPNPHDDDDDAFEGEYGSQRWSRDGGVGVGVGVDVDVDVGEPDSPMKRFKVEGELVDGVYYRLEDEDDSS